MKNLPVGVQSFEILIKENYIYVDKTEFLYKLLTQGRVYFLSRPRRFGKSLLLSTLDAILQNKKELFKDLWIEKSDYQWKEYPVIWIDMTKLNNKSPEQLEKEIMIQLQNIANEYNIVLEEKISLQTCFNQLIEKLSVINKVAVLIDEYDKPIIDHITDIPLAEKNREVLRGFYGILKSQDANLRFALFAGVTKFAKVSIFSGLNHLEDFSMAPDFANMLGYTREEIEKYFAPWITELAKINQLSKSEILEKIKTWYNGYRFSIRETYVYNPFSTLLLFKNQSFLNYWFETGTPTFLIKLIKTEQLSLKDISELDISELAFSTYDIERLRCLPLLYQTGYLTIKDYHENNALYRLDYPNREVEDALLTLLIEDFTHTPLQYTPNYLQKLINALKNLDFDAFFASLKLFFANIPYELNMPSEKYYQNVIYFIFMLMGAQMQAEVRTNMGRIDAVVEHQNQVFIFEFKLNKSAQEALNQIKNRKYNEKYQSGNKTIFLIGVNFNQSERTVEEWLVEQFIPTAKLRSLIRI